MTRGKPDPQQQPGWLMLGLLEAFMWLDRGLQDNLQAQGLPSVRRLESMVMLYAASGVRRPSDFAKVLGVTRQSINSAIRELEEKELIDLTPDPQDGRCKLVGFPPAGEPVRAKAMEIMEALEATLSARVGKKQISNLAEFLHTDLDDAPIFKQGTNRKVSSDSIA